ncbi:TonB-dependent receptor [Bacteroides sedimenti]|uniref:TonB-dependent receptor n=1 Tax=Bacteroides sedimenti TaxID=2136147 RepID=UPI00334209FF
MKNKSEMGNFILPFLHHRDLKLTNFPLIVFLFTVFLFPTQSVSAFSLIDKNVTIQMTNVSLGKVLDEVEKQSGYSFLVRNNDVNLNDKVSLNVKNESVEQILKTLFTSKGITYEIKGTRITIYRPMDRVEQKAEQKSGNQQKKTVTGIVKDANGETIIGVNVSVVGTNNATITDLDGKFILKNVPEKSLIKVSYIGFVTQEVALKDKNDLKIVMVESSKQLEEVVVVGYGVQKKENLTGSVASVKMEQILGDRPVSNTTSVLQGTIPGLQVTRSSTPGQNSNSLNIRGTVSINGGSPLVLIDNVPGDLGMLNPEDVETVTVLKDAASAAIYGARAAGGVVLVTTKRPKSNTTFSLSYNNNFGFESSINKPEQVSLESYLDNYLKAGFTDSYWANGQSVAQWKDYVKDYKMNPGAYATVGDGIYKDPNGKIYYLNEKDLFANMLETSFMTNHNLSASGGTEKLRYRIAAGYNFENGPIVTNKDQYSRKNVSAFLSADVTDWFTQEIDVRYSQSNKTMPVDAAGGIYSTRLISFYPEGDMPASISGLDKDYPIFTPRGLLNLARTSSTTVDNPRIFMKSIVKPMKGLEAVFEYTYNKNNTNYSYYSGQYSYTTIQMAKQTAPSRDTYTKDKYFTDYNAINAYATYSKSFGGHNFKLMGGFDQEKSYYEDLYAYAEQQAVQSTPSFGGATGTKTITDGYSVYTIRSGFYRLNYNWNGRYLLEVNGRYDGSSKFPKNERFGFFPSFSAGWQVAEEGFMKSTRSWLDGLKVRGSWGEIGNQAIDPYQYTPTMGINSSDGVWLNNGAYVTTIGVPNLVRSNFTWEKVATLDLGLDITMFGNRLSGTFDWYQRDTKGMLSAGSEIPSVVGVKAPLQNVADMRTTGWELGLSWNDKIGDFGYRVGFNVYDHTSKITKFKETGLMSDYYVGRDLGEIWGYVADGYYTVNDFVDTNSWKLKEGITTIQGVNVRPGDVKFKNLRDDEVSANQIDAGNGTLVNPGDRKIIGNNTSRYQFGANLGASYKGFDLSVMLQGTGKRDVWLSNTMIFPFGTSSTDAVFIPLYKGLEDFWKPISTDPTNENYMIPEKSDPKFYRLYGQMQNVGSNTRVCDKYLSNAAYLRVKNVTLSYMFPAQWLKKLTVKQLRMYVSVENLATITSLTNGIDPETLGWNYPFYRTTSFGASITF